VNWLDIVLLLILCLSFLGGIKDGFAKLVVGLAATILGFLCGLWFYGTVGALLIPYVSHKGVANFIGFLLIFFGVLAAGALIGKLLSVLLKWVGLSWIDRLLGGVFGLVRGMVVAIALVLALMAFTRPPPQSVVQSRVAPYVIGAANFCASVAPREVRDGVQESYEKIRQAWQQMLEKAKAGREGKSI